MKLEEFFVKSATRHFPWLPRQNWSPILIIIWHDLLIFGLALQDSSPQSGTHASKLVHVLHICPIRLANTIGILSDMSTSCADEEMTTIDWASFPTFPHLFSSDRTSLVNELLNPSWQLLPRKREPILMISRSQSTAVVDWLNLRSGV